LWATVAFKCFYASSLTERACLLYLFCLLVEAKPLCFPVEWMSEWVSVTIENEWPTNSADFDPILIFPDLSFCLFQNIVSSVPPRSSAVFVEWTRSPSFNFSSEKGRFEQVNKRFSGLCDENCEPVADWEASYIHFGWSWFEEATFIPHEYFGLRSMMVWFWASQPCLFF